jgi:hypothetical protein
MALAREEGVSECSNEKDEYVMLALPRTPVENQQKKAGLQPQEQQITTF